MSIAVTPWWETLRIRPEIINSSGQIDDVQMSLFRAVYAQDGDRPAYADAAHYGEITHPSVNLSDLLAKVKDLGDASKSELVRSCGYVSTKKDGGERLNFTAFYEALLEAKGLSLGNDGVGRGKGGRKLSYTATVQGNGNLLIGKAYTAMLDLKPGDEFEIKLGRKQIRLIPAGSTEEDEE